MPLKKLLTVKKDATFKGVIAFDLGRNMAWAYRDWVYEDEIKAYNRLYDGIRSHRFGAFMHDFPKITEGNPFTVLVYETPFARGRDATRSLWGLAGILEACGTKAKMAVVDVAVPTIKKFATGDGRASKDDMIAAAKKFGYAGNNEHEADAVCLLMYAEANLQRVREKIK